MKEQRRLISTRRRILPAQQGGYDNAWTGVVSAAAPTGVNAWRFHAYGDPLLYLEFLEFENGRDPRDESTFSEAIRSLDQFSIGDSELWIDTDS